MKKWQEVERIYLEAHGLTPEERAALLERTCAGDGELRAEVESLLQAEGEHGSFLQAPPSRLAAQLLETSAQPVTAIGPYRVIRVLGEGGMGTVYEAQQQTPRRTVALKVVKAGMAGDQMLRRFQQEAEALGRLQHEGIARIYDAGTAEQGLGPQPYFAMELIEGSPILRYAADGRLDLPAKLELLAKVCDAVHHAHQRGILHRDLKPGNILVDQTGQPKILDFGVARVMDSDVPATQQTDLGQLIGTLAYMSPEQAGGNPHDLDIRSDVYALGVILYELLAGQLPYETKGVALPAAIQAIQQQDPAALSSLDARYRGDVEVIVEKALEKSKDRRYESAAALASDLRRHLADEPITARPASASYQLKKFTRRHRALVLGTAAVLVALIGGVILSTYQAVRAREAEASARAVSDFLQKDLLEQADTDNQGGPGVRADPNLTVRAALERAARRIGGKFEKQPEVEANIRGTIGNTYHALGLYKEARQQLERALELRRRRLFRQEDATTLRLQTDLANVLFNGRAMTEAESLCKRTIASQRRLLGPESPDLLATETLLSQIYYEQGKSAENAALAKEIASIQRRVLGPDNPASMKSLRALAVADMALNRFAEAEISFGQLLQIDRRVLGPEHSATLADLQALGTVQLQQGKNQEAANVLRQVVESRRRILGPDHPQTRSALMSLAGAYSRMGRYEEAEAISRKVLAQEWKESGPASSRTAYALDALAYCLKVQKKYAESQELWRQDWEIRKRLFGPESAIATATGVDLATTYGDSGNCAALEPLARELMQTERRQRPDAPTGFEAESLLGRCMLAGKKFAEAEILLVEGFRGMEARKEGIAASDRDRLLGGTRNSIIQLYSEWGKLEQAQAWAAAKR